MYNQNISIKTNINKYTGAYFQESDLLNKLSFGVNKR